MVQGKATKLAVLIDADNAQPGIIENLLAEVAKYGTAYVKRAYGDWTGTSLNGWKTKLLTQSIQPIQQFVYTTGKNATDAAMVIDAMDLLYTNRFDGFRIVSSDRDAGAPTTAVCWARHRDRAPLRSAAFQDGLVSRRLAH
jgi:uncharacterized LabA/DUF88 family protein